jgi:hypothetical protein
MDLGDLAGEEEEEEPRRPRAEILRLIRSLLRLAADQAGKPEGETAAERARELIARYSVTEAELAADDEPPVDDDIPPPGDDDAPDEKKERKSQATVLRALGIDRAELWLGDDDRPYATYGERGHRITVRVRSTAMREWLSGIYEDAHDGAVPRNGSLDEAIRSLSGYARRHGDRHRVYLRVAGDTSRIVIDLVDETYRAIVIDAGGWQVEEQTHVRFRRAPSMRALPEPVRGGRLDELRRHIRLTDEGWSLLVVWLLAALRPGIREPILILAGQQDCGKSVTARRVRDLIDHSGAELRGEPRSEDDLAIAAANAWVVAMDNLSSIPQWRSDALCRLSTGGAYGKRTLYSDDDETLLSAVRPVILTSITDVASSLDLASRALPVTLPTLPESERLDEDELDRAWERDSGRILGGLCDAISCAIRRYDEIPASAVRNSHRMIDAVRWAVAAAPAIGLDRDQIVGALRMARSSVEASGLEDSPIGAAVISMMSTRTEWEGTSTELRDALAKICGIEDAAAARRQQWPWVPQAMTAAIQRLAPVLPSVGITYRRPAAGDKRRRHLLVRDNGAKDRPHRPDRPNGNDPGQMDLGDLVGDLGDLGDPASTAPGDRPGAAPGNHSTSGEVGDLGDLLHHYPASGCDRDGEPAHVDDAGSATGDNTEYF